MPGFGMRLKFESILQRIISLAEQDTNGDNNTAARELLGGEYKY